MIITEFLEELDKIFGIDTLRDRAHLELLTKEIRRLETESKKSNGDIIVLSYKLRFYYALLEHLKEYYEDYYNALLEKHYDLVRDTDFLKELGIKTIKDLDKFLNIKQE